MKKSLFAVLMVLSGFASAYEVGVNAGGVSGGNAGGIAGVTIGDHFGKFSADAGYARGWQSVTTVDRWSLVGGYDIAKVSGVTITPKIGYVYLNNSPTTGSNQNRTPSASAALIGVGASLPVAKDIAVTADYAYQAASNRNNIGNVMTAGVKYSF